MSSPMVTSSRGVLGSPSEPTRTFPGARVTVRWSGATQEMSELFRRVEV